MYDLYPASITPSSPVLILDSWTRYACHQYLAQLTDGMYKQFRKKVQAARSSLLATVIAHAGQIFNMPAAFFNHSESSIHATNQEIQRLVREENGRYGPCARTLFPQDEDQIIAQHIFLSMHIVSVSTV